MTSVYSCGIPLTHSCAHTHTSTGTRKPIFTSSILHAVFLNHCLQLASSQLCFYSTCRFVLRTRQGCPTPLRSPLGLERPCCGVAV